MQNAQQLTSHNLPAILSHYKYKQKPCHKGFVCHNLPLWGDFLPHCAILARKAGLYEHQTEQREANARRGEALFLSQRYYIDFWQMEKIISSYKFL